MLQRFGEEVCDEGGAIDSLACGVCVLHGRAGRAVGPVVSRSQVGLRVSPVSLQIGREAAAPAKRLHAGSAAGAPKKAFLGSGAKWGEAGRGTWHIAIGLGVPSWGGGGTGAGEGEVATPTRRMPRRQGRRGHSTPRRDDDIDDHRMTIAEWPKRSGVASRACDS